MLSSTLRKRYETTPLFVDFARPRAADHLCPGRPDCGRAHSGTPQSNTMLSLCEKGEHRITRSDSALGSPESCPGTGPICLRRAVYRTAFHFIQINFKRCNVRCAGAILPDCGASVKSGSGILLILWHSFLCNFNSVFSEIWFFRWFPSDFSHFFALDLFINF